MSEELDTCINRGDFSQLQTILDELGSSNFLRHYYQLRCYNSQSLYPQVIEYYDNEVHSHLHAQDWSAHDQLLIRIEYFRALAYTGNTIDPLSIESSIRKLSEHTTDRLDAEYLLLSAQYYHLLNESGNASKYYTMLEQYGTPYEDPYALESALGCARTDLVTNQLDIALKNLVLVDSYVSDYPYYDMIYHNLRGVYLSKKGDLNSAKKCYHTVITVYNRYPNHREYAFALKNLSIIARIQGNLAESQAYAEMALENAQMIGDTNLEMSLKLNLGNLMYSAGKFDIAVQYYEECRHYYEEPRKVKHLIIIYNNLGQVYARQGNYARALEYYRKADQWNLSKNPQEHIILLYNMSWMEIQLNQVRNTKASIQRMEIIIAEHELEYYEPYTTFLQGSYAVHTGDLAKARKLFEYAIDEFRFFENFTIMLHAQFSLSQLLYLIGIYDRAITVLHDVIVHHREQNNAALLSQSYFLLFQIHFEQGHLERADEVYQSIAALEKTYPSITVRKELAEVLLTQSMRDVDLSHKLLEFYHQIEHARSLNIMFFSFVLYHQCNFLLDRYLDTQDLSHLLQFGSVIDQILDIAKISGSDLHLCDIYMLRSKFDRIMSDHDNAVKHLKNAREIATKGGMKGKLVLIQRDESQLIVNK